MLVAFLFLVALTGKLGSIRTLFVAGQTRWLALRGAIVAVEFSASMYAFTHETLAKAYSLMFSSPLWTTALAAIFLKERVSAGAWAAIVTGLLGVLIVLRPGSIPMSPGIAMALLTAFCLSISNLIGQQIGRKPGMTLIAAGLVPQTVTLLCIAPFFLLKPPLVWPAPIDLSCMAFIGVTSGMGFVLLTLAFIDAARRRRRAVSLHADFMGHSVRCAVLRQQAGSLDGVSAPPSSLAAACGFCGKARRHGGMLFRPRRLSR